MTKVLVLRKECFGGTLFDVETGKRIYINHNEFNFAEKKGVLDEFLVKKSNMNGTVKIVNPSWIPSINFSAPDTAFFEVTHACNLHCTHCLNSSGIKYKDELSLENRLLLIKELALMGTQEIRFTGGEPLVLKEIKTLLSHASSHNLRTSIGTNAILATKSKVREIAQYLDMAIISLDGMETQHDLIRGAGTFQKAITGLKNFREKGIEIRVNAVIMKSNINEVINLAEFLSTIQVPLFIRRLIPSGRSFHMTKEMLNKKDYEDVRRKLSFLINNKGDLIQGHYINEKNITPRISLPFNRNSCSAGHRGIVILPNGKIHICGFIASLGMDPIGNIREEPLSLIWKRLIKSDYVDSLKEILNNFNKHSGILCTNCLAISLALSGTKEVVK